jgi:hypothetical protein
MPRYRWEGRLRSGASAEGEIQAQDRGAALEIVQRTGVMVTRLEEVAGRGGEDHAQVAVGGAAPAPPGEAASTIRRREARRDRRFYIGVALASTAISVGVAAIAPVLSYDCARDASGAVGCRVHRRVYGFIPLADRTVDGIRSARVVSRTSTQTLSPDATTEQRRRPPKEQTSTRLILMTADGTEWRSPESSWPLGRSNDDLAQDIELLLAADAPRELQAWQGEQVALMVAAAFLVPAALLLLGLVLRLVIPAELVERKLAEMEAARRSRLR